MSDFPDDQDEIHHHENLDAGCTQQNLSFFPVSNSSHRNSNHARKPAIGEKKPLAKKNSPVAGYSQAAG